MYDMAYPDNTLYIIGNGFDCHHNVKSSYKELSDWLKHNNSSLYQQLNEICEADYLWSEFERALPHISRSTFAGAELFLPDVVDDDTLVADISMAGDWARSMGESLWSDIELWFRKWVDSIRTPRDYDKYKIMLDYDARFINFNYTTFLESQYGIDTEQILYIHGCQASRKNPPIIGHSGEDTFNRWYRSNSHFHKLYKNEELPEYDMLTSGIEEYYGLSEKPVSKIIVKYSSFFEDLYDIKHVYVLGHSMAAVDLPYIRQIILYNEYPDDIKWHFSYYNDKEQIQLKRIIQKMTNRQVNYEFFKMKDLQLPY